VVRDERQLLLEMELVAGKANRARINKSALPRSRELLGVLRTVLFAPEDLSLVRGDPDQRRRFIDGLAVLRTPRLAGVRADYERVLKQRNALLKTAAGTRGKYDEETLAVWDEHLVAAGSELLDVRLQLIEQLQPHVAKTYNQLADRGSDTHLHAMMTYKPSWWTSKEAVGPNELPSNREELAAAMHAALLQSRREEVARGLSVVGPHRDDLVLQLGDLPAKGYASHGESWSFALSLRLASFDLLRADGDDPVLILDDVFAELDERRRSQLAELVAAAEQVLVTAAVAGDVPALLSGVQYMVGDGQVTLEPGSSDASLGQRIPGGEGDG